MTTQPRFWGHADTAARQPGLFDGRPVAVGLACETCGRELVETESGFACCPRGCGRLHLIDQADERGSGLWFGDDLTGPPDTETQPPTE